MHDHDHDRHDPTSPDGRGDLFAELYDELHGMAERSFRGERAGHTLQPTALVNEAFLRVAKAQNQFNDGVHVKAIAARAMRQALIDHARGRGAVKRGGRIVRVTFDDALTPGASSNLDIIDLDDALQRLAELNPRQAQVVELRFFAGMTVDEAADVLEVSTGTIAGDWRFAKAWLASTLGGDDHDDA